MENEFIFDELSLEEQNELLKFAINNGIKNLSQASEALEMKKVEDAIADIHIWQWKFVTTFGKNHFKRIAEIRAFAALRPHSNPPCLKTKKCLQVQ